MAKTGETLIAQNRKARHDYEILEVVEAGIVLVGAEVKSIRDRHVQLAESFARIENGEVWVYGVHINKYLNASGYGDFDPDRHRKLLLNQREIAHLSKKIDHDKLSLIPLSFYFKQGLVKVELALAKGKKSYDKRAAIAKRDAGRAAERELSRRTKGK